MEVGDATLDVDMPVLSQNGDGYLSANICMSICVCVLLRLGLFECDTMLIVSGLLSICLCTTRGKVDVAVQRA